MPTMVPGRHHGLMAACPLKGEVDVPEITGLPRAGEHGAASRAGPVAGDGHMRTVRTRNVCLPELLSTHPGGLMGIQLAGPFRSRRSVHDQCQERPDRLLYVEPLAAKRRRGTGTSGRQRELETARRQRACPPRPRPGHYGSFASCRSWLRPTPSAGEPAAKKGGNQMATATAVPALAPRQRRKRFWLWVAAILLALQVPADAPPPARVLPARAGHRRHIVTACPVCPADTALPRVPVTAGRRSGVAAGTGGHDAICPFAARRPGQRQLRSGPPLPPPEGRLLQVCHLTCPDGFGPRPLP
jgi:hypothetical protein